MASAIQKIEIFSRQCDFTIWLKKLEMISKMSKISEDDKTNFLLSNLDITIFESVVTNFDTNADYNTVVDFLKSRYSTQDKFLNRIEFMNVTYSGTYDEYASRLQMLYENFTQTEGNKEIREEILISKFLATIPKSLSTELRIRRPGTLSECVQICNSVNSSKTSFMTATISQKSKPHFNSKFNKNKNFQNFQNSTNSQNSQNSHNFQNSKKKKCYRCGSNAHLASDSNCPARNAICSNCKRVGHYSSVCFSKKNNTIDNTQKHFNVHMTKFHSENEYFSDTLVKKPHVMMNLSTSKGYTVTQDFLVDTGSDVCILPHSVFKQHFQENITPFCNAKLSNFDKTEIHVVGVLKNVLCVFNDKHACLEFLVCDNDTAVIGVNAISKLNLTVTGEHSRLVTYSIERTDVPKKVTQDSESSSNSKDSLKKIEGFQFYIQLKEDAPTSLIQKPRRVPFALESAIEKEISKLLADDIIEEIDSSPYLSPIVVVPKPGNEIRLCVDYKKINKHIVIDQHPLPTSDEIFARLAGAQIFSKLDLKAAYHQLEIREDSRNLTAFTSHVGQFRYKRLPFGLANAPSAYMKVIFNILRQCTNTVSYLDDILIYGKTQEEHDESLNLTLTQLRKYGITLNDKKCLYNQTSVQFLGRMLGSEGVSPLHSTVESILEAQVPHDKHSLRSFMGLINFYRNFIPNAAGISAHLYDLLKDQVPFRWTEIHTYEFESLKNTLRNCVPLAYFDSNVNTPTYLTTDASGYGISAVLSQVDENGTDRPVYFLSRKLSDTERTYAASEKEFLAVLWGTERLHQYLYGRPFTIRTDHQCLRQLLMNGVEGGSAPCRVIRWATRLLQYNFQVEYIPGKANTIADALSRVPQPSLDSNLELFAVYLQNDSSIPVSLHELKIATQEDDVLQTVIKLMNNGWPDRKSRVPEAVQNFWNVRNELSYVSDVLLRNEKFIVPAVLRDRVVNLAHESHMGITKCKTRIREFFWWPCLNSFVESQLKSCGCCHEPHRDAPVQVPNYVHKPWHQLSVDIKGPVYDSSNRPYYIVTLIDCYSKFTSTHVTRTVTSKQIIAFLSNIFSMFGNCMILLTDNGPQFISHEFEFFLRSRGIVHKRSSLYNAQGNGVVERMNKNLSKVLENSEIMNGDMLQKKLNIYVQNYNCTKHSSIEKSPAEVMFNFTMKTNLCMLSTCDDEVVTDIGKTLQASCERNADYANERRRPSNSRCFSEGDFVLTKQGKVKQLGKQVGKYTFRLSDGFTLNVRHMKHKVQPPHGILPGTRDLNTNPRSTNSEQNSENSFSYVQIPPANTDRIDPSSGDRHLQSDFSERVNDSSISARDTRPTRARRRPLRFGDYVTER